MLRGPAQWRVAGAAGLGLVALAIGLLEGAIFLRPIVLAILPAAVIRTADIAAIAAGVDAAVLGGLFYLEDRSPHVSRCPTGGEDDGRGPVRVIFHPGLRRAGAVSCGRDAGES